jgi:hypothetical protein
VDGVATASAIFLFKGKELFTMGRSLTGTVEEAVEACDVEIVNTLALGEGLKRFGIFKRLWLAIWKK